VHTFVAAPVYLKPLIGGRPARPAGSARDSGRRGVERAVARGVPGAQADVDGAVEPGAAPGLRPEQRAVLTSLAEEALGELDELTARAVQAITSRAADVYGARGIVIAADLRSMTRTNCASMLGVLAGSRTAGPGDLALPLSAGRRRAEQAVPLEAALHAFRLGGQEVMSTLLACARRRTAAELATFLEITSVPFDIVDMYSQAVVEGYRQSETQTERGVSRRRQAALDSLLDGTEADPAACAAVLGLPAQGPYALVVCALQPPDGHAATAPRDVLAAHGLASAWRLREDCEVGIVALGGAVPARVLDQLRASATGRLGLSGAFDSLHGVPDAHRLAAVALRTVEPGEPGIAWIEERLLEAMVVSSPDLAGQLASRTLGRLLALREPDRDLLLETLSTWFECDRSAGAAAGRLYCHRNTVLNRLRRVEEVIGRSLDHHNGVIDCYIALLVLRLLPQESARMLAAARAEKPGAGR
jgi:hypothetical protein